MERHGRVAVFGGVYSNWLALEAALADMERRGVDAVYCLGDLGAFGPHPDRTVETADIVWMGRIVWASQ